MLEASNTVLLIIDIQGKLARIVNRSEAFIDSVQKLIRGIQLLSVPIIWMEQIPVALGPTVPEIAGLLEGIRPIDKCAFSCCGNESFVEILENLNRHQVLLAGIETHICVYQTAVDLRQRGYDVHVVADAVSSRTAKNRRIGIQKMCDAGAVVTSVETVLFELLRTADRTEFRQILKIVK